MGLGPRLGFERYLLKVEFYKRPYEGHIIAKHSIAVSRYLIGVGSQWKDFFSAKQAYGYSIATCTH